MTYHAIHVLLDQAEHYPWLLDNDISSLIAPVALRDGQLWEMENPPTDP